MNEPLQPDQIVEGLCMVHRKLTVRSLEGSMVLVEGDAETLEAFGSLLIAQARAGQTCGIHISPNGAGNAAFSSKSNLGFYIHRTPCDHEV
jgi:hypothetical protein